MNALDLVLVGGMAGLVLGMLLLGGRPQVMAPIYPDERRRGGSLELFVALALGGMLILVLAGLPPSG